MNRFIRCVATTKSGAQCKSGVMPLTPFCGIHQDSVHPHIKKIEEEKSKKRGL